MLVFDLGRLRWGEPQRRAARLSVPSHAVATAAAHSLRRELQASALALFVVAGCTSPGSDREQQERARCDALANLLDRYTSYTPFGTGPHLGKSIAVDQCDRGNTPIGISMLEDLLRRHRIEVPHGGK